MVDLSKETSDRLDKIDQNLDLLISEKGTKHSANYEKRNFLLSLFVFVLTVVTSLGSSWILLDRKVTILEQKIKHEIEMREGVEVQFVNSMNDLSIQINKIKTDIQNNFNKIEKKYDDQSEAIQQQNLKNNSITYNLEHIKKDINTIFVNFNKIQDLKSSIELLDNKMKSIEKINDKLLNFINKPQSRMYHTDSQMRE